MRFQQKDKDTGKAGTPQNSAVGEADRDNSLNWLSSMSGVYDPGLNEVN